MRVSEVEKENFERSNKYHPQRRARVTVGNKFELACTIGHSFPLSEPLSRARIY